MKWLIPLLVLNYALLGGLRATAEIKISSMFGDHMVLQREMPVAVIKGPTVEVQADGVGKAIACRYAFSNSPAVNLVNKTGLPAAPFRTDN